MTQAPTLNRRLFMGLGAASAAGLLIGCSSGPDPIAAITDASELDNFNNAWLHLSDQGEITFFVPAAEMGQGVQTALTMIIADEMDADWTAMNAVLAPANTDFANPEYTVQTTGGSTSVKTYWTQLRELGASAREMLVEAAALKSGAPASSFTTADSVVTGVDGQQFSFAELAGVATKLSPPSSPRLKQPEEFRLIGKSVPRVDTEAKISGKPIYGIDVVVPGMKHATIAQTPVPSGGVAGYDEAAALAMPGVSHVVDIPDGVAVVADSYWRALKGLEALDVQWDSGPQAEMSTASMADEMATSMAAMGEADIRGASQVLDLEYDVPLLAHQPLEPMNCIAHVKADSCEVWVPTQNLHSSVIQAAEATGLPRDKIKVNPTHVGGGFGRRLEVDYVSQAVLISKALGAPVKMVWSREEDMRHDFYRPAKRVRMQIGLGDDGAPIEWRTKLASPSHFQRSLDTYFPELSWLPVASIIGDVSFMAGLSTGFTEGNPFPYEVGDLDTDGEIMKFAVPTGSYRSVQHLFSGFCKEAAIDECADATGRDPLAYRKALLKDDPQYRGVLDLVAEKADWGAPAPRRHQGLALHRSFDTYVAEVAEVSVEDDQLKIHRIVYAVDCGLVVNPAIAESLVTGGVLWGVETAMFGEITVANGAVEQGNFDDYRLMYLSEAPPVEVHSVKSDAPPTGLGEPSTPPVAAALTNAIFAATGRRIGSLPIVNSGLDI